MARPRPPRVPGVVPRILAPTPARPASTPRTTPAPTPRPSVARPSGARPSVARPSVARPPIARAPIGLTTAIPLPAEPPAGLDSKELADWHVAQVHAHERLRTLSFYDTGHHLMQLLAMREHFGARDIKELCSKVDLGMSHMTAHKYLQVARHFDRDTALREGIEKCYALTLYAKATGREGQGAAILARDEPVRGEPGLRVSSASASKLYGAVRALKEAARTSREPSELRATRERTAKATAKLVRSFGFKGAHVEIVRRGGEPRVAIYISLETAEALEPRLLQAVAKRGPRLAKARPELLASFRAAGWRLTGAG